MEKGSKIILGFCAHPVHARTSKKKLVWGPQQNYLGCVNNKSFQFTSIKPRGERDNMKYHLLVIFKT